MPLSHEEVRLLIEKLLNFGRITVPLGGGGVRLTTGILDGELPAGGDEAGGEDGIDRIMGGESRLAAVSICTGDRCGGEGSGAGRIGRRLDRTGDIRLSGSGISNSEMVIC